VSEQQSTFAESAILGASERIDYLLPLPISNDRYAPSSIMRDLLGIVDHRLKLRIMVSTELHPALAYGTGLISPGDLTARATSWYGLEEFDDTADFQFVTHTSGLGFAIVDGDQAVVVDTPQHTESPRVHVADSQDDINAIQRHFDHLWTTRGHRDELRVVLYEDLLASTFPDRASQLIILSNDKWQGVLRALNRDPEGVQKLSPREFEELVAHLLERQGYSVSLTQETRDGGKDILIATPTDLGDLLYVVECKRYAPDNPIGVSLVRELYGVVEHERATAGILVTSSYFSNDALKFRDPIKHRMTLHDYNKVVEWISKSQHQ
jgi:hypothetical protein